MSGQVNIDPVIKIITDDVDYIIRKSKNSITINGNRCSLSYNKNNKEMKDVYDMYIESKLPEKDAELKAALYEAIYTEISISMVNEMADLAIFYLLGRTKLPALKSDLSITITDQYIYNSKKQKSDGYYITSMSSCSGDYDYQKLFLALINDN